MRPSVPSSSLRMLLRWRQNSSRLIRACAITRAGSGQKSQTISGATAIETSAESEEILSTLATNSQRIGDRQADRPVEPELHTERRRHALATLKAEKYRIEVAEKGREPDPGEGHRADAEEMPEKHR